jgi:hypothetical protein
MSPHTGNHSWNSCDSFQDNSSVPIAFLKKSIGKKTHAFSKKEGNSIRKLNGGVVDGLFHNKHFKCFLAFVPARRSFAYLRLKYFACPARLASLILRVQTCDLRLRSCKNEPKQLVKQQHKPG